ncbi:extracellular solute-binding protein [Tenggerimyces flavus]|uniref:Extracellular solute-binding protein n=1 Tax=Tenggerimyces flavus TaxID=1708749 RepID=A0ABV7Y6S1_9ACTN|nr:extracellular solute-binding protein [Tenggerimyces flavus]MBM7791052.1 multiple sugar transport system substrate-binding protein [Tenggerimyces flavus]
MDRTLSRRVLLGALAAGTLAACAPSGGPPPSTQNENADGLTTDDGVKDVTFTSWSMNEAASKAQLQELLDAYKSSAGVTIKTPSYPYNDYLKQVILQLQGGQVAGAVQLDVTWVASLGAMGKLADLAPLAKDVRYTEAGLKVGQYDGKQVGLPWTHGAIGLVGNSELIERAGITTEPETLEDFEAALTELKGLGGGVVPYAAMTKVANLKDIVVWMWTFGSPVVEDGKIVVGDEPSVEALTWYKGLYDKGLIGKDMDRFDARALFGQGKVGLYDDAAPARKFVSANATDPKIGEKLVAWKRPVLKAGDQPQAMAWGHVLAVVAGGEGEYAAGQFVKHLTSDADTAITYFKSAGYPPTTQQALENPTFTGDPFASSFVEKVTATSKSDPLWVYPQSAQLYETLAKQVQAILIGDATPKQGLETAREAMQKLVG